MIYCTVLSPDVCRHNRVLLNSSQNNARGTLNDQLMTRFKIYIPLSHHLSNVCATRVIVPLGRTMKEVFRHLSTGFFHSAETVCWNHKKWTDLIILDSCLSNSCVAPAEVKMYQIRQGRAVNPLLLYLKTSKQLF